MNDFFNRRQFLTNTMGIGSLALAWLLQQKNWRHAQGYSARPAAV